jgi:hypothetical protein
MMKQVKPILRGEPNREVARRSIALCPLAKFTGIRKDLLQLPTTWQMHWETRDFTLTYHVGQVQGSKSLYQIGKELRLVRSGMPVSTDNAERAAKRVNGRKVAVSRMLSRSNCLAHNAAVGVFPCVQPLSEPIVWHAVQLKRMQQAVEQAHWQPQFESLHQQADELDQT